MTLWRLWGKPDALRVNASTEDRWTYWTLAVDPDRNSRARAAFQEHMSELPGAWQKRMLNFSAHELERRGACNGRWVAAHSQFRLEFEQHNIQISGLCPALPRVQT